MLSGVDCVVVITDLRAKGLETTVCTEVGLPQKMHTIIFSIERVNALNTVK